ncbi:hypothetical protein VSDG_08932 [Cytospora chrysosperma]|uniref:Uncharacterized protein n=1 Tax=Cytospora chrysosperma TaxID=252740 RepID=A0A423VD68_CYTCH|nr:hypothetical protein VSDG_08932 [Valsa sordida]
MKFTILPILAGFSSLVSAKSTTAADTSIPKSTDASSFLSDLWSGQTATPTWATGKYATKLATALYSVETSFAGRDDYRSIIDSIWSAAEKDGGSKVVESMSSSYWDWSGVTTNDWYQDNMPKAYQTAVAKFDEDMDSAFTSVEAEVTATKNAGAPRCTGMAVAGVALGFAAVAGVM